MPCFHMNRKKNSRYTRKCPSCLTYPNKYNNLDAGELTGFCNCGYKLWDHYDHRYFKCYCIECRDVKQC